MKTPKNLFMNYRWILKKNWNQKYNYPYYQICFSNMEKGRILVFKKTKVKNVCQTYFYFLAKIYFLSL